MGELPSENRQYQLQELTESHKEIIRRAFLGEKKIAIATDMRVSPQTVSYVIHSELGRQYMRSLEEQRVRATVDIREQIEELAPLALETLADLLNDHSQLPSIRLRAATDLLDRAGYKPPSKSEITVEPVQRGLTREDRERIKEKARRNILGFDSTSCSTDIPD